MSVTSFDIVKTPEARGMTKYDKEVLIVKFSAILEARQKELGRLTRKKDKSAENLKRIAKLNHIITNLQQTITRTQNSLVLYGRLRSM